MFCKSNNNKSLINANKTCFGSASKSIIFRNTYNLIHRTCFTQNRIFENSVYKNSTLVSSFNKDQYISSVRPFLVSHPTVESRLTIRSFKYLHKFIIHTILIYYHAFDICFGQQHYQRAAAVGYLRPSENDRATGDVRRVDAPRTMALARGALHDRRHQSQLQLRRVAHLEEQSHHG